MPPVDNNFGRTERREQLPPLPTKEDRLYGALLLFRKAKEGPLKNGITKITVTPRDVVSLYQDLLNEALALKKERNLSKEQYDSLHITPKEVEDYIRSQDDVALQGELGTRILRPVTKNSFFGVPVPTHPPTKSHSEPEEPEDRGI